MEHTWLVVVLALLLGGGIAMTGFAVAEGPSSDSTVTNVEVNTDGSAEWTIEVRTALESESDVEEYEAFKEDFNEDHDDRLDSFESRMSAIVSDADANTERDMAAHSFSAEASIEGYTTEYGVTRFTFVWDNFAAVDESEIYIGDAFEGELYISDGEHLQIYLPEDYTIVSVSPEPDRESTSGDREYALWSGPYEFVDGEPMLHGSASPEDSDRSSDETDDDGDGILVFVLIGGLVLTSLGLYIWRKHGGGFELSSQSADADSTEESLITDEERVLALLDSKSRVKQPDIRDELDWSDSKTSRVLSNMEENGTIEKLRLGRENIIRQVERETE